MENTTEYFDLYLERYLDSPDLKAVWKGWHTKLRANIAATLAAMEQEGWLAEEENLIKVHNAVREGGVEAAFRLRELFPAGLPRNALIETRNQPWTTLSLSTRACNCIKRIQAPRIATIGNLADMHFCEILRIRNCGKVTRKEIARALREAGVVRSGWFQ